jgi:hypothetical protein
MQSFRLRSGALATAMLLLAGVSQAADEFSTFGNADVVQAEQKNQFGVLLTSDVTQSEEDPYAGIAWEPRQPLTFAEIRELSARYAAVEGGHGGGSPRIVVGVDTDSDDEVDGNVSIYLGTPPSFDDEASEEFQSTGNLVGSSDLRFDTSQVGGTFYDDYAGAVELVGDADVGYVLFVVDAGWFFEDGVQSVLVTDFDVHKSRLKVKKPKKN